MTASTWRGLPLAVVLLVSCQPPPEPTPLPQLEPLERPTMNVPPVSDGLLSVSQTVVVTRSGVPGVFLLLDGLARFQMIKTGHPKGKKIEILSGLRGGEVLVSGSLAEVRDGTPIVTRR